MLQNEQWRSDSGTDFNEDGKLSRCNEFLLRAGAGIRVHK